MQKFAVVLMFLTASLLLAACNQNVGPPAQSSRAAPAVETPAPSSAPSPLPSTVPAPSSPAAGDSAAGVAWKVPERWVALAPRPMRAATYRVPAAGGGDPGECAVFFFGAGQGGDVDANLKRWLGQFENPSGGENPAKTDRLTVNGMKVTTVDVTGTYLASAGPMAPSQEKKPGYRLLGAIVEAPDGNVFFKFTGPEKTVAASASGFQSLLQSLRKD